MIINKTNFLSFLAAGTLVMASACSDSINYETSGQPVLGEGSRTVELTVMPEVQAIATRADSPSPISSGERVNTLVFEMYEITKNANGEITSSKLLGKGRNEVDWDRDPYKVLLSIDPEKDYRLIFWAQKKGNKYYDITHLSEIKINYTDPDDPTLLCGNNDEDRDAFWGYGEVLKAVPQNEGKVILHRPFAQINVGTSGWDYEGAAYLDPERVVYNQSTFTVKGVAQTFNGFTGEAVVDEDNKLVDVVYSFSRIPAYINLTKKTLKEIDKIKPYTEPTDLEKEEILTVRRFDEDKIDILRRGKSKKDLKYNYFPYVGWDFYSAYRDGREAKEGDEVYDYGNYQITFTEQNGDKTETKTKTGRELFLDGEIPYTEEYKYLSMCYVLVPEMAAGSSTSATVNVEFQFKGNKMNYDLATNTTTMTDEEVTSMKYKINNVPVHRNWRTNILGNSFFVENRNYFIDVVPLYCGDYDQNNVVGNTEWSGWLKNITDADGNNVLGRYPDNRFLEYWAPEYYGSYRCTLCGYVYKPWIGEPRRNIEPTTLFENLPDGFTCPGIDDVPCGAHLEDFEPVEFKEPGVTEEPEEPEVKD